jgi:hypothetical protein
MISSPQDFNESNPENYLLQCDASFEEACIAMKESNVHDVKNLTVFEWEQTYLYFKKRKGKNNVPNNS